MSSVAKYAYVACIGLLALACSFNPTPSHSNVDDHKLDDDVVAELRQRRERSNDLTWIRDSLGGHSWLKPGTTRDDIIEQKHRALNGGDAKGAAQASALLAAEAQTRADLVLERWLGDLDPETGLLPKGRASADRVWDYADTGADLFPHLMIAASLLQPESALSLTRMIATERSIAGPTTLPSNVDLKSDRPSNQDAEARMYGSVEYAKDGLLPLLERLGSGPWTDRLVEIAYNVTRLEAVPTRFGPIPSDSSEVNGQALQVLSRVYWLTGDESFPATSAGVSQAYLDLSLPATGMIPGRTWDFERERSNTRQAQLRDHGNEIVAGLIEHHIIETVRQDALASEHRQKIRGMLKALMDRGRSPSGLWYSAIDFETGESLKDTLSDNWGYVYAAYLTQAMIEERWPGGDLQLAEQYRAAAERGLNAAADLDLYPWQGTEQDGYADTIESALYLLNQVNVPRAAAWVDRQTGTLFGAQDATGRVEDRYLDGNFVRTALLYASWQTQGIRLEPWSTGALVGASPDGDCTRVALSASQDWSGRVVVDAPRHRTHLNLPFSYPRLNAWPEWFTADDGVSYRISDLGASSESSFTGTELQAGLPIQLTRGTELDWRICPT